MTNDIDVLVVGAGPVGLFMACELVRHGAKVRLIESADGPTTLSKALAVHARTMEIFQDIGIAEKAIANGVILHGAGIFSNGKCISSLVMDELDSPFPYILSLEQSKTEQILIDHLSSLGGNVERVTTMTGFHQDDAGVTATIEHDGVEEAVRAACLVGCDGAHSTTRHALSLEFQGDAFPQTFMLADVKLDWDRPDDELTASLTDHGLLFVAPLAGGRARIIADEADEDSDVTLDMVQTIIDERAPVTGKVSDPAWMTAFRISERQVDHYRVDHVFLAGDAAHIHSPAGGQGMNTGIQDAYNLAWKLGLAIRGRATDALIESYNGERHPIGAAVLRSTGFATRAITLRNPVARHLRDKLAGLLTSMEVVQERMRTDASQLAVGYRDSAIVSEHRSGGTRAFAHGPLPGQRAPDGDLMDPQDGAAVTLFDLLRGPTHALVFFAGTTMDDGDEGARDAVLSALPDDVVRELRLILITTGDEALPTTWDGIRVVDTEAALHRRYGADRACLYLIRPDGYVGYRAQPLDAKSLLAYFNTIMVQA
ncbi:MAG: FAD-dependent monooxygenase [Pseudomonadota bacterium]